MTIRNKPLLFLCVHPYKKQQGQAFIQAPGQAAEDSTREISHDVQDGSFNGVQRCVNSNRLRIFTLFNRNIRIL
jgi:hypothetical protein